MKKPYFSIVIITYNRSNFLKANLKILLRQSFKDYEIVISDNASTDNTAKIVNSFKDKNIRFIRNRVNIGFPANIKKAMLLASGKYIFTLGDDDFILTEDTLRRLKYLLDRNQYGIVRLNILERNYYGPGLQKKLILLYDDKKIKANSNTDQILDFYKEVDIGMMSGIIFKNKNITPDKFIDCETYPWFKVVIDNTRKYGAYFLSDCYIVITWTKVTNHQPSWIVKNNRLEFETYDRELFKLIPNKKRALYRFNYYKNYISLFPVIKLYSTNKNLIRFARRLLQLEPKLKEDMKLWFNLIVSLIIPKIIWIKVRLIYHGFNNKIESVSNLDSVTEKYNYLMGRYYKFLHL
ncbi:hypothetical protein A3D78_06330 [Candidatus Gottesmanbacteria bacterium RIFCSPHIGHO2_02_FULL_39_14]|uniref:Glycosyltransferase 2-like domain-containing protein n=1 Tax=Candidatus Gottesmanbacteria bacterium RIFCSPHIGHO2_02_FULL_39_14 TaxID=1798383 RepID=A0A1F6A2U7_9BACT|nr:MAG: hypothetical protein A3D78_06330 [Candidatus Gottesmanbacteria bacterium RIFCSPHIGHO2_02_FULL_39_14]